LNLYAWWKDDSCVALCLMLIEYILRTSAVGSIHVALICPDSNFEQFLNGIFAKLGLDVYGHI